MAQAIHLKPVSVSVRPRPAATAHRPYGGETSRERVDALDVAVGHRLRAVDQEAADAQTRSPSPKEQRTASAGDSSGNFAIIGVRNIEVGQIIKKVAANGDVERGENDHSRAW
ncbi:MULTISPECIES: hypothetical protein [Kitasatospora]|uniref:hypothetical protein n=1 Tax=Kitasatospora TaxID=2063 RepID=UPI0011D2BFBD|nr:MULTISPECIES: hypothetical protein [Kitasatospora]